MPRWSETVTEGLTGTSTPLRFVWNERGLERVELASAPASLADAYAVEGELTRRFPALRLLLNSGRFHPDMVKLSLGGTELQRRVWSEISTLLPGTTISYRELAERVGRPDAIRAVASACGANPVPLVIPCHRVIASDGTLGGFIWGLEFKQALLDRERAALHPLAA